MTDRLAEIKSGHLVGDDDVDWLIAEIERLEALLTTEQHLTVVLTKDAESLREQITVLESWQRGQIAVAVKCQKERTECPVCLDQAARSMSCPECGTMVVRCTEAGVEALDRLASDRADEMRSTRDSDD